MSSPERPVKSTQDNIEIRDYRLSSDFQSVAELLYREGMFNPERDRYEQLKKLGNIPMKVAVAMGERIVGSLYINGGIGVVEGVVVHPDFRRQGVGRRLVQAAMEQLRDDGHRAIELQIDDDRDDLKAWYESLGFKRDYRVVGMIKPLGPDPAYFEIPEITENSFDRESVNRAFEDLYWKYRCRLEYSAELEPDYQSPLTPEQLKEVKEQNPTRSGMELRDAYTLGWFMNPPLYGERIPKSEWGHIDDILKNSPISALRDAYFFAWAWPGVWPTPWIPISSTDEGPEIEHVQCWLGRQSELAQPLEPRSDFNEAVCIGDAYHKIPNDNFLFLRQIKGVQRFGRPPSLWNIKPDGDFLCYDQANKNLFAFRIEGESTELLNPEETAIMLGDLVKYTKAYEMMAKGYHLSDY